MNRKGGKKYDACSRIHTCCNGLKDGAIHRYEKKASYASASLGLMIELAGVENFLICICVCVFMHSFFFAGCYAHEQTACCETSSKNDNGML